MTTAITVPNLTVWAPGRPAPQGSKELGEHGQMRESSVYLPPWRQAIKRAVFERYRAMGITRADLPLFRGPVGINISFALDPSRRTDAEPDGDKLDRAVWDALTKAKVWEDDGRVVSWGGGKTHAGELGTGAHIFVWPVIP